MQRGSRGSRRTGRRPSLLLDLQTEGRCKLAWAGRHDGISVCTFMDATYELMCGYYRQHDTAKRIWWWMRYHRASSRHMIWAWLTVKLTCETIKHFQPEAKQSSLKYGVCWPIYQPLKVELSGSRYFVFCCDWWFTEFKSSPLIRDLERCCNWLWCNFLDCKFETKTSLIQFEWPRRRNNNCFWQLTDLETSCFVPCIHYATISLLASKFGTVMHEVRGYLLQNLDHDDQLQKYQTTGELDNSSLSVILFHVVDSFFLIKDLAVPAGCNPDSWFLYVTFKFRSWIPWHG